MKERIEFARNRLWKSKAIEKYPNDVFYEPAQRYEGKYGHYYVLDIETEKIRVYLQALWSLQTQPACFCISYPDNQKPVESMYLYPAGCHKTLLLETL